MHGLPGVSHIELSLKVGPSEAVTISSSWYSAGIKLTPDAPPDIELCPTSERGLIVEFKVSADGAVIRLGAPDAMESVHGSLLKIEPKMQLSKNTCGRGLS